MSQEFYVNASYGRVDSIYTDFGTASPAAIGRKVQYVAPYNGSISAKYVPQRAFKGFSTNVGITFVGATPTESPIAGDTYATQPGGKRVVTSSTGQWNLKAPAYLLWYFGARYRMQGRGGFGHTLAVNVNNVTDETYFRGGSAGANSRYPGEGRAVYFTYTLDRKGAR